MDYEDNDPIVSIRVRSVTEDGELEAYVDSSNSNEELMIILNHRIIDYKALYLNTWFMEVLKRIRL